MNRNARSVAVVAVLLAAVAAAAVYYFVGVRATFDPDQVSRYYAALRLPPATPVDIEQVRAAVARSAAYLRRANLDSGQFIYLVNMDPAVTVPPEYNLLRHAGTIYSIGMANSVVPDPQNVEVMRRAAAFMRECCLARLEPGDMAAVWEPNEIVHSRRPQSFKLGGAGLALVALTSLAEVDPASMRADELAGLGRFGQFMQRWNGQFYANHVPSKGGRQLPGASLYYPGEMALGWLMLYERQPDRKWIDSAVKALKYLARERAVSGEAPADHWALLATARLFQIADREGLSIPRELLFNQALQVCHTILEEGRTPPLLPAMEGALVPLGEVTPTATRLEGLLAARTFLTADQPITAHVDAAIHRGVDFLIRAQTKEGPYAGALPYAITTIADDGAGPTAAFNARATEVRIDYVQHGMSAMVQYLIWIQQRTFR